MLSSLGPQQACVPPLRAAPVCTRLLPQHLPSLDSFHPAGTGGAGRYRGGDGVVRELEFLRPLTASILSERRAVRPFGLLGGGSAAPGLNLWIKRDGRVVSLGGKATVQVEGGDRIQILTPGGGGYGPPDSAAAAAAAADGREEQQQQLGTEAGVSLAEAVSSKVEAKRRRTGSGDFSAPVRDGGSVAAYVRNQETV